MSIPARRRRIILDAARRQLAIDGGPPACPGGPPPWPPEDRAIGESLAAAFEAGAWGKYHGPFVPRLEELIAKKHDSNFALTCCSGTIAVELALRGLKIGPDHEVILAGYDFAGNFRAIESVGARPVLVDLAKDSWAMDPNEVHQAITPRTGAVVVSHLHASIAPMREIKEQAAAAGIAIVEDACQAHGAQVEGRVSGTWGDVGVWSFGGSKLLSAGRGGAIYSNREDVYQRIKIHCERGNHAFALSELQAAAVLPQLAALEDRNRRRQDAAAQLHATLADVDCLTPAANGPDQSRPSYYKLSWFYESQACGGRPREAFIAAAQAEGVAVDAGFRGFIRRPESRCRKVGDLPNCRRAVADTLVLHHPLLLGDSDLLKQAGDGLRKIVQEWSNSEDTDDD